MGLKCITDKINNKYNAIFESYHDYYYLKQQLKRIDKVEMVNTLILGSSYARFGIDDKLLGKDSFNLSLPSQDLYYAKAILERIIKNKRVKNICIAVGYYSLYSDLSKTKNKGEIERVWTVYKPLLQDTHNSKENLYKDSLIKTIIYFPVYSMAIIKAYLISKKSYYNTKYTRKSHSQSQLWNRDLLWEELQEVEKEEASKIRADAHNKSRRYKETMLENKKILEDIKDICKDNNSRLRIVVFPVTDYYNKHLNWDFLKELESELKKLEIEYTDLNNIYNNDRIDDSCFVDPDHLNDKGALIITNKMMKKDYI